MTTRSQQDVDLAKVKLQLERSLPWLMARGYKYEGVEHIDSKLLHPFFTVAYTHEKAQRRIEFGYARFRENPEQEAVTITVRGPSEARFSLADYLTYRGVSEREKERISLQEYGGSLEERLASVLCEVRRLLEGELLEIVSGTNWIEVPFDWGDYR